MRKICVKLAHQNLLEEEKYYWMPAKFFKTVMMTLCLQLELKFIGHLFVFVIQNNIMANQIISLKKSFPSVSKVYINVVISVIHLFENILRETVNKHAGLAAVFVKNHSLKFLLG
jgi:hypothetical protein